jgi:hypothetical protein
MAFSKTTEAALRELNEVSGWSAAYAARPVEFPEPDTKLDLDSRQGDEARIFKHIHQTCVLHVFNFLAGARVKVPYLSKFYLDAVRSENPLAVYAAARSILEFAGFINQTAKDLRALGPESAKTPMERGTAFFRRIVNARYATSEPTRKDVLVEAGFAKTDLKLPNITDSMNSLAELPGCEDARNEYRRLCDFTHHSLSSQRAVARGFDAPVARAGHGMTIVMPKLGPVTRYQFPLPDNRAVEQTAGQSSRYLRAAIDAVNHTPESPFTKKEVLRVTGNKHGVRVVPQLAKHQLTRVGRNDECPCGSGKKFKKCCLPAYSV